MGLFTIFSKGSWFDFGRKIGIDEKREQIAKSLDALLADDFISVFTKDGNTVKYSKQDFITLITKKAGQ